MPCAHRAVQRAALRLHHGVRGASARAGEAGRAGNRRGRSSRAASRDSVRRQGPAVHAGRENHARLAPLRRPCARPKRDRHRAAATRRRHTDRQGEPARIRQRRDQCLSLWPAAQSLESGIQSGWFFERVGDRGEHGPFVRVSRRRHRRLGEKPRCGKRRRRAAADVRPGEPIRRRHVRLDRRHHRSAYAHRRRQRPVPAGDRRLRSERSVEQHAPGSRLSRVPQARPEGHDARGCA